MNPHTDPAQLLPAPRQPHPAPRRTTVTPTATPTRVHVARPDARRMLLNQPEPCTYFPALTLAGTAPTPAGDHYLIVTLRRPGSATVHTHLGLDPAMIARHGLLLVAGPDAHHDLPGGLVDRAAILGWLADCWTSTLTEAAAAERAQP